MTTEKAIEMCKSIKHYLTGGNPVWSKEEVAEALDMAIEALQTDIVRCKDCKHWQPHSQHGYDYDDDAFYDYCGLLVPDDDYYAVRRDASDFCSFGERSEE